MEPSGSVDVQLGREVVHLGRIGDVSETSKILKDVAFDLPEIRKALRQFVKQTRAVNENNGESA